MANNNRLRFLCLALMLALILLLAVGCGQRGEPSEPPSGGEINPDTGTTPDVGGGNANGGNTDGGNTGGGEGNAVTDVLGEDQDADFVALFCYENRIEIKLDIPAGELKKIQEDYERYSAVGSKSPIYRKADLYVKITTPAGEVIERVVSEVGVRMKGNTSRTDFYSDGEGMYNLIHFKVSFGETFDEEEYYGDEVRVWASEEEREARKDRTFATLEKIDLRWNRNDDPTFIREIYCYDIYRELGLLAPHTNLVSMDIGEDHAGLFIINEPIDKLFLEKNLPKEAAGGDLYKLGWTYEGATFTSFTSVGKEDEDKGEFFIYDIKTNKKKTDHSALRNLIEVLNSGSLTKEQYGEVVDVDAFLKFAAASYMIGNPDDLRNNYNNCYIYFRPDTGKAVLIPYDTDRGLGVNVWNPYGNGMTTESPFGTYSVQGTQRNPLFTKSIITGGFYVEEFKEILKEVGACQIFEPEVFRERFDLARSLYGALATPSRTYRNAEWCKFTFDIERTAAPGESANMSFADYITAKRATLERALEGEVNDDIVISWDICIRADFTGWDIGESLTEKDGVFEITVTRDSEFRFKLYNKNNGAWFGTEVMSEDTAVEYESDGHTNVVLPAGSYIVRFDTQGRTITVLPAE